MFKTAFNNYKRKFPTPELSNVLDPYVESSYFSKLLVATDFIPDDTIHLLGLVNPSNWRIRTLNSHEGFIIICNPFTNLGQRYWITQTLSEYTKKPSKLNLHLHDDLVENEDWWTTLISNNSKKRSESLAKKLRWATFGYHYNWDTKEYNEEDVCEFPSELSSLCKTLLKTAIGYNDFKAQAAIVNFYHFGSTLSGHVDRSEHDLHAPLVSLSFGQSALFLLGGETTDEGPQAIYLRSGDVVIMTGYSRLCYHAVPRIVENTSPPYLVRDVNSIDMEKYAENINYDKFKLCTDYKFWKHFDNYLRNSRVNLTIRQMFPN